MELDLTTKYKQLPEDLREALRSTEITEKIQPIGAKHRLHIDQAGELATSVDMVIAGLLKPNDFARNIQIGLNIDHEKAVAITQDINQEIFLPVRESLQKLHQERETERPESEEKMESPEEILEVIANPEKARGRSMAQEAIEQAAVRPEAPPNQAAEPSRVGSEVSPPRPEDQAASVPLKAEIDLPKLHQEKLKDVVRVPKQETKIETPGARHPIIPEDIKKRINTDPYKEPI